jgi:tetratricopeptide (TPR) repeat protein
MSMPSSTDQRRRVELRTRLDVDPCDSDALVELGAMEFAVFDQNDIALEYLKRAVRCNESAVNAKFWLAMVLFHGVMDWDEAGKVVLEALLLDPHSPESLILYVSLLHQLHHPPAELLSHLERAMVRGRDWPVIRCQRAQGLFDMGRFDEATAEVQEGIRLLGDELSPPPESGLESYFQSVLVGKGSNNFMRFICERLLRKIEERKGKGMSGP